MESTRNYCRPEVPALGACPGGLERAFRHGRVRDRPHCATAVTVATRPSAVNGRTAVCPHKAVHSAARRKHGHLHTGARTYSSRNSGTRGPVVCDSVCRGVQKANPERLGAGERRGRGWEWPLREPGFPFAVKMCPETDRGGGCTKCHWITHLKTIKMMNFVLRSCITIKSLWCLCFEDLIFAQSKINCP